MRNGEFPEDMFQSFLVNRSSAEDSVQCDHFEIYRTQKYPISDNFLSSETDNCCAVCVA